MLFDSVCFFVFVLPFQFKNTKNGKTFYSSQKSDLKIKNVIEIIYNCQQNKSKLNYKKKIKRKKRQNMIVDSLF